MSLYTRDTFKREILQDVWKQTKADITVWISRQELFQRKYGYLHNNNVPEDIRTKYQRWMAEELRYLATKGFVELTPRQVRITAKGEKDLRKHGCI